MRITNLRLTDFKRHASLDLGLAPGLTVIRGPNEAGKSTIQRAVEMALFRRATSTAQELDGIRTWANGDTPPRVRMEFHAEEGKGSLSKVFAGPNGISRLEIGTEVHTDPTAIDVRLAELTGIPSEKFFRSTACIRHQELTDLDRDEGALRDRLQQSMSGADRGTFAARRKLQEAIARTRADGPKNPGPLRQARDAIARLSDQAARGESGLATLGRDRGLLAVATSRREELDARLANAQADLHMAERAVEALGRKTKAEAEYQRYKRAAELREEIDRAEANHPSAMALPALKAGVERLRSLEFDILEKRAELASQPDVSSWQAEVRPAPRWLPVAGLAVLAVLAAAAVVILVQGVAGIAGAAGLAIAAAGMAVLAFVLRRRASQVRLQNEMLETEIARRLSGRSDLEEDLKSAERQRQTQIAALGMPDLATADVMLSAESEHVGGIEQLRAEYRGLLIEALDESEDVAQLRDRHAATADEARHVLAGMGPVGADPPGHRQRADVAVRSARDDRERAMADEATARSVVDSNPTDAEEVAATAERLDQMRGRLAALERRLRVYQTALTALDAAEVATMKKAARFLEERMGPDVSTITGGRYQRIRVDENALDLSVHSGEKGDWVPATDLSRGTLDQIYLAARLGLVRQVTQDRRPPLVFDDPLVTFDDDRALRAFELLKHASADHQVIYLTCSDRYDSRADKVIELTADGSLVRSSSEPA